MASYKLSSGKRLSKKIIDRRIKKAKELKKELFFEEHGYYFCEHTKRTDCRLSMSHIISVKECQNNGNSELSYDIDNLELLSDESHLEIEQMSNPNRIKWYYYKKNGWKFSDFKRNINESN